MPHCLRWIQLALGDFDRHDFRYTSEPVLANILFVTYIGIMTVVLLNLLIAIMGDSYDRVKDKEVLEFLRGKVRRVLLQLLHFHHPLSSCTVCGSE